MPAKDNEPAISSKAARQIVPDYTLYLVTDRQMMKTPTLEDAVEQACEGGVTFVQLREKNVGADELCEIAASIKEITDAHNVGLIIDNDAEVAAKVDALGVHLGPTDMPTYDARKILGPDKIIGRSAGSVFEAMRAQQDGADYLGVGAMVATPTKPEADITTIEELGRIIESVDIPVVAIGGIDEDVLPRFTGMGVDGFAVVSAIMAKENVKAAASNLRSIIDSL